MLKYLACPQIGEQIVDKYKKRNQIKRRKNCIILNALINMYALICYALLKIFAPINKKIVHNHKLNLYTNEVCNCGQLS